LATGRTWDYSDVPNVFSMVVDRNGPKCVRRRLGDPLTRFGT
jgi:hypothetical protein